MRITQYLETTANFIQKIALHKIQEPLNQLVYQLLTTKSIAFIWYMRLFKMRHTVKQGNHSFDAILVINQTATF